jgi:uncharacterized membrane protein
MAITTHALHTYMSTNAFGPKIKLEHVVSFGDAVFAFAITLMTLSIDIPDLPPNLTESQLLSRLYDMYPQVESYIISLLSLQSLDFISSGFQLY